MLADSRAEKLTGVAYNPWYYAILIFPIVAGVLFYKVVVKMTHNTPILLVWIMYYSQVVLIYSGL